MQFYTVVALAAIAASTNAQLPGLGALGGGAAAAPAGPEARLTAQEVKASIEKITDKAADAEVIAKRINSKADGFQVGPELIVGIKDINQLFAAQSEALAAQDKLSEAPLAKEPEAAEPPVERRQLPTGALSGLLGQKKAPGKASEQKRQLPVGALGGLLGQKKAPAPAKGKKEAQKGAPAKAQKAAPVKAQEQKRQLPNLPLPGLDSVTGTLSPEKEAENADAPVLEQVFFAVEDQAEICYAFNDLVKVHEMMLNTVTSKREFFTFTTITAQTAKVLRLLEREVDEFAAVLIGFVPTCGFSVKKDQQELSNTMKTSIETFTL